MKIDFDNCKDCETTEKKLDFVVNLINQEFNFYYKPHYNSSETCKYLKISKKTLENYCSSGDITFYKSKGVRYFLKKDLDSFIRRRKYISKYRDII